MVLMFGLQMIKGTTNRSIELTGSRHTPLDYARQLHVETIFQGLSAKNTPAHMQQWKWDEVRRMLEVLMKQHSKSWVLLRHK